MDKDIYSYVAGDVNYRIIIMQKHIRIIGHTAAVRHRFFTSIAATTRLLHDATWAVAFGLIHEYNTQT